MNHLTRRGFLRTSGVGLGALTLPNLLQARAAGRSQKQRSCILIFLEGGASHIDTFDMKPAAPAEFRGEFAPIQTSAPGLHVCEHLPLTAQVAQHFAVVRSITQVGEGVTGDHHAGIYYQLTGHAPDVSFKTEGNNRRPQSGDWPFLGVQITCNRPRTNHLPPVITLPHEMAFPGNTRPGQYGGKLGAAHAPVFLKGERDKPDEFRGPDWNLLPGLTLDQMTERRALTGQMDRFFRGLEGQTSPAAFTTFQQQAFDMVLSRSSREAFDLQREPEKNRERYGRNLNGQGMLLARRLVEAGVPFLSLNWQPAPGSPNNAFWDTHADNFNELKKLLLPEFDRGFSALLADLHDRGLLESTVVYVTSEMGRTPRIGDPRPGGKNGRDHWVQCGFALLAGGGIRGGQAYGASDRIGAYPSQNPVGPEDLAATVYHALGVPRGAFRDSQGRPHFLLEKGDALRSLFG
jgi:hypothetical protein